MEYVNPSDGEITAGQGRLLFLVLLGILVVLAGLLVSLLISPESVFWVIGLVASCVAALAYWPKGGLLVILIASVMPRLSLGVGGWNARPEHFAVGLIVGMFGIRWVLGERPKVALSRADYYVLAYILWNYVSSLLTSPDPRSTLRWALLNNVVILPYFLIRLLVRDERTLRWVFKAFLGVGIVECAYGIICFVSRQVFGTSFGVEVGQYAAGFGGVYGTHYEPNLLGSYAACTAFALLVVYFVMERKSAWALGGAIVAVCAMVVSLSRAALLSFGIVLILMAFLAVRRGLVRPKRVLLLAVGLGLFGMPIVLMTGQRLTERLTSFSGGGVQDDAETVARLVAWTVAVQDIWQHPLVGNGTASFQLLADAKQMPILGDRPWIGNSVIRILHDTGAVGLLLFGLLTVTIGKQAWNGVAGRARGKEIIFSLSAGCLVYAIAFLATEGTILAFFWIHVGLLASAVKFATADGAMSLCEERHED